MLSRRFIGMSTSRRKPYPELPDELVMELLMRLPSKQVARCKCVCKLWRSMIASARFKDVYGSRHHGMICYWAEPDVRICHLLDETASHHLSFNYSPIRGLEEPKEGEFRCLYRLAINSNRDVNMTQIVNGLSCVDDHDNAGLSLYNVCTGERMRIPDLVPPDELYYMSSSFHLGYDPSTRQYKLLRLIARLGCPTQAQIITLSSSSSSTWRELSGIPGDNRIEWCRECRVSPTDGFLCWGLFTSPTRWPMESLVFFNISNEKFQQVYLPPEFSDNSLELKEMCVRAQFTEQNKRLAVSVWCICGDDKPVRDMLCFVMLDDEGKRWSKHAAEYSRMVYKEGAVLVAANWNSCEMLTMDSHGSKVCCYGRDYTMARSQIGKIPTYWRLPVGITAGRLKVFGITRGKLEAYGGVVHCWYQPLDRQHIFAMPSYLSDANNLYLPLRDILAASN